MSCSKTQHTLTQPWFKPSIDISINRYLIHIMILINEAMPTSYMLGSTGSFVNQICSFDLKPSHVIASYDVAPLFTNIPLNETIDIACSYAYRQHSKETINKLLQIATGGYFLHRGKQYCQIDGVTMGSQLGPTLATFGAHLGNQFNNNNNNNNGYL